MLGKRKATMRRTSSVCMIGSGSVNGDSSPLPDHPKEKVKYSSPGASSCCSAPRQVIGFHPKGLADEGSGGPMSPHRPPSSSQRSSSKSPSGSPRSGLGDLLAGSRPWERKDEGVGLGIVAAFSGGQEDDVGKYRDDAAPFGGSRKTSSPQAHGHMPSIFAPSRASPPIPIHPAALLSTNSSRQSPSRSTSQNCGPTVSFGMAPPSFGPEPIFLEGNGLQSGDAGSRPSYCANGGAGPWARYPNNGHTEAAVNWSQQADMELDRIEPHGGGSVYNMHSAAARQKAPSSSSAGFSQVFLNACHLCKRRLGEGRDIYIYRGDKAFCSPECRHQQIMNDEQRPEKCAAAVMKVGGGADARSSTQRSRVMAGGTATAAAA